MDITTVGATIIYALVSASARKLAITRNDRTEKWTGAVGFVVMAFFLAYVLLPNLVAESNMAKESFLLFIVWTVNAKNEPVSPRKKPQKPSPA